MRGLSELNECFDDTGSNPGKTASESGVGFVQIALNYTHTTCIQIKNSLIQSIIYEHTIYVHSNRSDIVTEMSQNTF